MPPPTSQPVVLFGYTSSPFTQKIRLSLHLKRIPHLFLAVPSMLPRPALTSNFHLTYRKIPVLAIGRDIYIDTSLICEALESRFPESDGYGTLYPPNEQGRRERALVRGFASYWTDRPLFRVTTGLIPAIVWRTQFGVDRADLIGHKLDPEKLEAKVPQNLAGLDLHLSLLEEQFSGQDGWVLGTKEPGLADVALFYQLDWGLDMAAGKGIYNLTGGGTSDVGGEGAGGVFNEERYPGVWKWFGKFKKHVEALPSLETVVDEEKGVRLIKESGFLDVRETMIPIASKAQAELDARLGLVKDAAVSVAPDDTGRDHPTFGTLLDISPEEVVIRPAEIDSTPPPIETRLHFPRLGFVVRPVTAVKL